jgi:carnitine-CoA ligase
MTTGWTATELHEFTSTRVVGHRLRFWAESEPNRPFFRCGGGWRTFGDVDRTTDAVAGALDKLGVGKGERVALVLPNCEQSVLSTLALAKLGAIQIPVNPYLKGEFLRHQLADSGAKCVISDTSGLAEVNSLRAGLPKLEHLVSTGREAQGTIGFDELVDSRLSCPDNRVTARDTMAIMYTSGTTGLPKGCVLSQGYYMFLPRGWLMHWYRSGDRVVTALPLFHIAGQGMTLMSSLQAGLPATFLTSFSASQFIADCRETQATFAFGVGPMAMAILARRPSPEDRDHGLRIAMFPPLSQPARLEFAQRFGVEVVTEAYGQTECNPVALNPLEAHAGIPGALGMPAPWLDVELVDADDNPVPQGEPGEIVIRPREPMVMFDGYWENPAATVAASRDLWHHTGDMARRDASGVLVFFDRKKDAIRRRGENISCVEVETAIGKHPKIAAVATHGLASPLGEDDLKAWIVLARGETLMPAEFHDFLKAQLPYFAVPRYVQIIDELPTNPLNRVQKFKLREMGNDDAWDFEQLGLHIERDQRRSPDSG